MWRYKFSALVDFGYAEAEIDKMAKDGWEVELTEFLAIQDDGKAWGALIPCICISYRKWEHENEKHAQTS